MKVILDIATILGGIGTVLFLWDRFIASRSSKSSKDSEDSSKDIKKVEGQGGEYTPQITTLSQEPKYIRAEHSNSEFRWYDLTPDEQSNKKPLWLLFATPAYCGIVAGIICSITFYAGILAAGWVLMAMLIPAFIGLHLQSNFTHEDAGFLLSWGSYIIFMTGMAGIGTISDNKLDLSDPTVRTIYFVAEMWGGAVL